MNRHLVVLLLLLPACRTTGGQALRTGAAALGCPPEEATVAHPPAELDAYTYRVTCGGRSIEVECQDPRTVDRSRSRTRSACRAGSLRDGS